MDQPTIKINCDTCGTQHTVSRDSDAPEGATSMGCNWCPKCEDRAEDYYNEWYNFNEGGDNDNGDDPNQLMMFSIADEVLENHVPNELKLINQ